MRFLGWGWDREGGAKERWDSEDTALGFFVEWD